MRNQKLQQVLFVIYKSVSLVVKSHPAFIQLAALLGLVFDQHKELQINVTGYDSPYGLHLNTLRISQSFITRLAQAIILTSSFIYSNAISYIEVTSVTW